MPLQILAADTPALRAQAFALRTQVFVVEQDVPPELELDELDATAFHAVALLDGACVGTGRLVAQPGGVGRVGRMAVAAAQRRGGVGGALLARLEEAARAQGLREIELHAQVHAEGFYARHGYAPEGERFEEAGIAHVVMRKRL